MNGASASPLAQRHQGGRPKGSRNKLGEHFIAALCADFEAHGVDVITRVREDDPAVYLRVIAQVVPQTVLMQDAKLDDLSDDELAAYLFAVREALGGREGAESGAGAAGGDEPAEPLSPVSEAEGVS
jgi:hypothetical protein